MTNNWLLTGAETLQGYDIGSEETLLKLKQCAGSRLESTPDLARLRKDYPTSYQKIAAEFIKKSQEDKREAIHTSADTISKLEAAKQRRSAAENRGTTAGGARPAESAVPSRGAGSQSADGRGADTGGRQAASTGGKARLAAEAADTPALQGAVARGRWVLTPRRT